MISDEGCGMGRGYLAQEKCPVTGTVFAVHGGAQ
jgi:hypothetical protein